MQKRQRTSLIFIGAAALIVIAAPAFRSSKIEIVSSTAVSSESESTPITLLFAGDIMLTRDIGKYIAKHNDWRYPFLLIASTTQAADIAFANLESQISSRGKNQGSIYSFRADPRAIAGLAFAGFDILSTVNNHSFDYGPTALVDTIDLLLQAGIVSVGTGRNSQEADTPYIADIKGTRIAFFAYTNLYPASLTATQSTPGISSFEKQRVSREIAEIQKDADIVVVSFHWGEEYEPRSHPREQAIARALIDAGADLVIGHHPHVVQEIERYKEGYIAYSLGNFVFDQGFSKATMEGLMVRVVIEDKKVVMLTEMPVTLTPTFQPYLSAEISL